MIALIVSLVTDKILRIFGAPVGLACLIDQLRFRMRYAQVGNEYSGIDLHHPWVEHVQAYGTRFHKTPGWELWMLGHKDLYGTAFEKTLAKPMIVDVAFRYERMPLAYSPAWRDESEHMNALKRYAEAVYAGWIFNFIFNGESGAAYASVIAGTESILSRVCGPMTICLYFETIFHHEFGHLMGLRHHYAEPGAPEVPLPPGETQCIFRRNSVQFCSACRTALHIPLDVDNGGLIEGAMAEISSRYPYM